jgi:hypothetical protein
MASTKRQFVITELRRTGAGVLEATPTIFRWDADTRTAPHGDIEQQLQVKTVRTEYPGSDEPTEQVLAATWQPFDLGGEWQDRHAGQGFAMATYRDFARMVLRAPLVRLQLEQWSIIGLITNLRLSYVWEKRVAWTATISPHVHETVGSARTAGKILQPSSRPPREHAAIVEDAAADLRAASDAARLLPTTGTTTQDAGIQLDLVDANVDRLNVSVAAGLEIDATAKLQSIAGQFRATRDASISASVSLRPVRSGTLAGFDDAVLWLRLDEYARSSQANQRALALSAQEAEDEARNTAQARPLAIYRPAAGESPYRISARFYGTPNEWRRIWEFNALDTFVLTGEEELVIPQRGTA